MGITPFGQVALAAGVIGSLVAGSLVGASGARADEPGTVTYGYIDPGSGAPVQTFVVPAGVGCLWVEAVGASGAPAVIGSNVHTNRVGAGGRGGTALAPVEVTPGESLELLIGGAGGGLSGGFNGGGASGAMGDSHGGGGGGATDLRQGGSGLEARVLVAGGGGGGGAAGRIGGAATFAVGGDGGGGGGLTGGDGMTAGPASAGRGGTQTGGGVPGAGIGGLIPATPGSQGLGGVGGVATDGSSVGAAGGGGGGGWYGGSGGPSGAVAPNTAASGGGGGSGHGPAGTMFGLAPAGNGSMTISYDPAMGSCSGGGRLVADYQFLGSSASSVGTSGPLAAVGDGTNVFAREVVDGSSRPVLEFPTGNGVDLSGLSSEFARRAYTIVVLVRLDAVDGFRRLVNFAGDDRDEGLYLNDGTLTWFPGAGGRRRWWRVSGCRWH